jgi:hypothetical protein
MEPDTSSPRRPSRLHRYRTCRDEAQTSRLRAMVQPPALFAALFVLVDCSSVPLLDSAEPAAAPAYGTLVSDALKKFKDYVNYSNFEISSARWVHSITGWNWLICVRYDDAGHQRYYSFFIENNKVVNQHYDIVTDQCAAQQYVPFDATTGTVGSPTPVHQQPIY